MQSSTIWVRYIIICLLVFSLFTANAQSNSFGLKYGIAKAKVTNFGGGKRYTSAQGVFYRRNNLKGRFGLETGLSIHRMGLIGEFIATTLDPTDDYTIEVIYRESYLSVPVLAMWEWKRMIWRIGLSADLNVESKLTVIENEVIENSYLLHHRKINTSLEIGAVRKIRCSDRFDVNIGKMIKYQLLTNYASYFNWRNINFELFVGVVFKLKNSS